MNALEEFLSQPGGIAAQLKELRTAAGLTGAALGAKVGWSQAKVSKLETGNQKPTREDLRTWAAATEAAPEKLEALTALLAEADVVHSTWRHQVRHGGQSGIQRNYDEMARKASVIRNLEPVFVPGLLQTADYARARIEYAVRHHGADPAEVDSATLARMRRQEVLYDSTKRFEFVLGESVLRYLLCPPTVMRAQLGRLVAAIGVPNVTLAIVPFGVELPVPPHHGFILFDDEAVVELFGGDVSAAGEEAAPYRQAMDQLLAEAVTGEAAQRLIVAAADTLH